MCNPNTYQFYKSLPVGQEFAPALQNYDSITLAEMDTPAPPYEAVAPAAFVPQQPMQRSPRAPVRSLSQDNPTVRTQYPTYRPGDSIAASNAPPTHAPGSYNAPEYYSSQPQPRKGGGLMSNVGSAISSAFNVARPSRKIEDVYIAVMGVTGAGKSTFIKLCSGQDVKIGKNLKSCTLEVGDISFMWNDFIKVHLIDTPGFDDTNRSDTDVLKDIAGWLTSTYQRKILLSGIIYLHRISDPRMGGSQMRNLTMFKELCGKKCFPCVILATTFWGATDQVMAERNEKELIETKEFWGYMVEKGSQVMRHTNDARSANRIVETLVKRDEKFVTEIQHDMVDKGLGLEDTAAAYFLNKELREKEKKHLEDMRRLEADMLKAIEEKDREQIEVIAQLQKESQDKIAQGKADIENLQASVKDLQRERDEAFEKLDKELKAQAEQYKEQVEAYNRAKRDHAANAEAMAADLEKTKSQLEDLMKKHQQKKTGWSRVQEFVDDVVEDLTNWFKENL